MQPLEHVHPALALHLSIEGGAARGLLRVTIEVFALYESQQRLPSVAGLLFCSPFVAQVSHVEGSVVACTCTLLLLLLLLLQGST